MPVMLLAMPTPPTPPVVVAEFPPAAPAPPPPPPVAPTYEPVPVPPAVIATLPDLAAQAGDWLQCSYNGNFRGVYPGMGFTFDGTEFIPPVIEEI